MSMVTGRVFWAKLNEPRPNKFKEGAKQWSFDLSLDEENKNILLKQGMKPSYIRNKGDERGDFISFVRDEQKADGSPGKPFSIVDSQKQPWPADKLIGNGSTLNCVVKLNERTFRGDKFLKPSCLSIQVWSLKEYSQDAGFSVKEGEQLNDDLPSGDKDW